MHPAIQAKSLMWRRRSWGFWICRFINFNPWFVNYSDGHFNPYPYVLAKPCITSYILRLRPLSSGPLHIYVQDQSIAHPYLQRSSISSLYLFTKYIRLKSISHTKTGRAEAESPSSHQYSGNFLSKKDGRCKSCVGRWSVGWTIGKVRARIAEGGE